MEEEKASRIAESMEDHGSNSYYYSTSRPRAADMREHYAAEAEPELTGSEEVKIEEHIIKPISKYGFLNEEKFVRVYVEFPCELNPDNIKFSLQPQSFTLDHIISPTETHRLYLIE
jgi:hypothetical protein